MRIQIAGQENRAALCKTMNSPK